MQLEIDILNQELATARRQIGEMERQVALLKVEIQHYKRKISRQNHLVAQIAHTIKFYSSDSRVEAERSEHMKPARPEIEQVPRQDSGWI
jgi:predicted  nucleic acid-binding Zn-ribbon protein